MKRSVAIGMGATAGSVLSYSPLHSESEDDVTMVSSSYGGSITFNANVAAVPSPKRSD